MGNITKFLSFYGHGEQIFGDFVEGVDRVISAGAATSLCTTMQNYGSDKGLGWHNYTILYHHLFDCFLADVSDVFELGIGTNFEDVPANMGADGIPGASLRGWREHFPRAQIYGADIDRRVLFQEDRIATLYVDQTDPASIISLWDHTPASFDIIIDDGLHEFEANKTFLQNSKRKLKQNGLYIVEDIISASEVLIKYDKFFDSCEMSGFMYRLPYAINQNDNTVAVLCGPAYAHRLVD